MLPASPAVPSDFGDGSICQIIKSNLISNIHLQNNSDPTQGATAINEGDKARLEVLYATIGFISSKTCQGRFVPIRRIAQVCNVLWVAIG
jgi:hypothetical protein